jgi:hypothetical protein
VTASVKVGPLHGAFGQRDLVCGVTSSDTPATIGCSSRCPITMYVRGK